MGRGRVEEAMRAALPEDLPVLGVRMVDDQMCIRDRRHASSVRTLSTSSQSISRKMCIRDSRRPGHNPKLGLWQCTYLLAGQSCY